jgi:hypothetical protein
MTLPTLSFPAWRLLVGAGVVITIAVLVVHWARDQNTSTVIVASRDLPAYHRITAKDITKAALAHSGGDIQKRQRVIGSVTTEKVTAGSAFDTDTITAPTSRPVKGLVFMRFHATAIQMPGIQPGDDVVLRFAPVAAATTSRALSVPALLVADTSHDSGPATYVTGIAANDVQGLLGVVARSRMIVTRGPVTPTPAQAQPGTSAQKWRPSSTKHHHHRRR